MTAVKEGNIEVALLLLQRGADPNPKDAEGTTALYVHPLLAGLRFLVRNNLDERPLSKEPFVSDTSLSPPGSFPSPSRLSRTKSSLLKSALTETAIRHFT